MDYYEIGQRIRAHRKALGLSQEKLAEAVNISVTHMSHIETGNTKLSLSVLAALAGRLQAGTDELLFGLQPRTAAEAGMLAILRDCTEEEAALLLEIIKSVRPTLARRKQQR